MKTIDWIKGLNIAPGSIIGKYVIAGVLGQGGTAAVYRGYLNGGEVDQLSLKEEFALKVLNPSMLNLEVEKGRLALQMKLRGHNCPYLVQPIEWFPADIPQIDGSACATFVVVYGYVKGDILDPTQIPEERIRPILAMIWQAARYLEQEKLYHRDIKPDNVIITQDWTRAVLLDLGVLHAEVTAQGDSPHTGSRDNLDLVTQRYSSPEVLIGSLKTPQEWLAHTLYQIGAIIFEAITERRIFDDKTGRQLDTAIAFEDPFKGRPVRRCQELEPIARTCLEKQPAERLSVEREGLLEFKRYSRKPTIVLLYCGGTIGADTDAFGATLLPRKLGPGDRLPQKISDRLRRDYTEQAPGLPLPNFEWRFVPKEFQIFSENSSPTTWNSIADTVSRILAEDWSGKYLLGFILLHGTDTLAYSAAALQLAFPKVPCPIILTGSNRPPSDEADVEQAWHMNQSDAWTNLLRSVLFLVDGGHRLAMIYVAFANTICHAVNVQKTPLNRIPLRFAAALRFLSEAFGYRNVELGRRFAYKYVEEALVNNFLPILEEADYQGPPDGASAPWERPKLDVDAIQPIAQFSPAIKVVEVYPSEICELMRDGEPQLIVAYPSGTLSDSFRESMGARAMLVTQWGLAPHQAEYAKKVEIPGGFESKRLPNLESKLFRLIPETALPLISLAVSYRQSDIESGLVDLINHNPIVRALLGNPLNRGNQQERGQHLQQRAKDLHERAIEHILFPTPPLDSPAFLRTEKKISETSKHRVNFRRHHFDALIYGLVAPHCHAGSLAEQFGALCDIGFDTGISLAVEWDRGRVSADGPLVERLMKVIDTAILASGLAKVTTDLIRDKTTARLRMRTKLESLHHATYDDSWVFDSAADHRFLAEISNGVPLELSEREAEHYFDDELKRLQDTRGLIRTTPVYWYLLGIVKGALCWCLSDRTTEPLGGANAIRSRVVLRLLRGAKHTGTKEAQFAFSRNLLDSAEERDLAEPE
jgi:serine/threonine protein kinase